MNTIKNWKYYLPGQEIGILQITKGQFMTGNIMGILVERREGISEIGSLTNAQTFDFPVRYKIVEPLTNENFGTIFDDVRKKITQLETEGCRFIVTTGGRMGKLNTFIQEATSLLTVSTPLVMVEYAALSLPKTVEICIINNLTMEDNREIFRILNIPLQVAQRCIFSDTDLKWFRNWEGISLDSKATRIGAYIWDSLADYNQILLNNSCPIYCMTKIANFLKDITMQIPYGGGI